MKENKIEAIQGLRGIAAIMVFLSHALCMPISPFYLVYKNHPLHFFYDGQIAVVLFIVISGFFYWKERKPSIYNYMAGLKSKIIRIFPPYVFSMIIAWGLCNCLLTYDKSTFTDWANTFWQDTVSLSELIKSLTVVWPHDFNLINPPTWYIGLEVRFFLLIPILIMLCNTKYTNWWILIILIPLFIVNNRFYFAICLCGSITKIISKLNITNYLTRYKSLNAFIILVALFLLNIRNEFSLNDNISYSCQTIGACLIVLLVSLYNYKWLCNKVLLWLGNISLQFYLCHFGVLLIFRSFYYNLLSYVLISFIMSLLLSVLVKKICEFTVEIFIYKRKHTE